MPIYIDTCFQLRMRNTNLTLLHGIRNSKSSEYEDCYPLLTWQFVVWWKVLTLQRNLLPLSKVLWNVCTFLPAIIREELALTLYDAINKTTDTAIWCSTLHLPVCYVTVFTCHQCFLVSITGVCHCILRLGELNYVRETMVRLLLYHSMIHIKCTFHQIFW
jgi:hypothetical protein